MRAIYEPKGRAREYCELAINLYRGCSHGCIYCYAPKTLYMNREAFYSNPQPRSGILEAIRREAHNFYGWKVLLCFSCDPYQPLDRELKLTREAIHILQSNNIRVRILTKSAETRDFDLLKRIGSAYGATLTFIDPKLSQQYEPNAALPEDRMNTLKWAHRKGIYTWVSLEPVIEPLQTLELIERTHKYVCEYKVGKLNYAKTNIDWKWFAYEAIRLLKKYNKKFYIKKDLAAYL